MDDRAERPASCSSSDTTITFSTSGPAPMRATSKGGHCLRLGLALLSAEEGARSPSRLPPRGASWPFWSCSRDAL
eukprot:9157340-Pyramimonas_sp.AAC.1